MVVCIIISILNCWIVISVSGGLNGATSHAHGMHEETSRRPSSVSSISTIVRYTFFSLRHPRYLKVSPRTDRFYWHYFACVLYNIHIHICYIYIYFLIILIVTNRVSHVWNRWTLFLIYNYREAHLLHMTSDNIIIFD